jgi:hypothetical protein
MARLVTFGTRGVGSFITTVIGTQDGLLLSDFCDGIGRPLSAHAQCGQMQEWIGRPEGSPDNSEEPIVEMGDH